MGDDSLNVAARIEALLFFKGEPLSVNFLSQTLETSEGEIREGILALEHSLQAGKRGLVLVTKGEEVMLATTPNMSPVLEKLTKHELEKDLGKAALETLSLVLYRGPISQSSINHVRGVNSNYIVRSLLVRGLIEKTEDSTTHKTTYRPTFELLSYMGVSKVEDLPEYTNTASTIETFTEEQKLHDNQKDESFNREA